jgi:hypothetical protein
VALQGYYQLSTFSSDSDTVSQVVGGNAGVPLGGLMAVKVGYEFSSSRTTGDVSSDVTGNLIWASAARRVNPSTTIGVSGSYTLLTLDDARIWNASVFNTYELGNRFSMSSSAGVSVLSSSVTDNEATFTTNTTAFYRLGRFLFAVALNQDFQQTFTQGEDFGIVLARSYTGSVAYEVTPLITATIRASYDDNQLTGVGDTRGTAKAFTGEAGLSWQVRRWLTATLNYTYTRYDGDTTTGGAAPANRVVFRLSTSF